MTHNLNLRIAYSEFDTRFCVGVISATSHPNTVIYSAMHQDYYEGLVYEQMMDDPDAFPDERHAGEIIVRRLLKAKHFGPLEHPTITFNVGYFPHSVMQQARTHRVGISFDCQSGRYTGKRIIQVANGEMDVEDVFYLRPVGDYTDRKASEDYRTNIQQHGMSEEHARGLVPFDIRQHFVVSFNCRSLMHFLDLRAMKDAQLEIGEMCNVIYPLFQEWCPEISSWYTQTRKGKNQLAP
jgi:thymidylate synthase (FAD)